VLMRTGTFLAALIWVSSAHAQTAPIAPDAKVSPLSRTTIFVRDLDESLKLYRDILGLKPRRERILEGPFWNEINGTPGENKRVQVVILQTTTGEVVGNVGLFQFIDENDGPPVYKPPRVQTGDVALIMLTREIFPLFEKVKQAGYTIISPPRTQDPNPGPNSSYEMMFFDRDGVIINFIQSAPPTAK
jgi:catechol 2,3-dioxygenase-like lactoylglutathione lyase family enzyme